VLADHVFPASGRSAGPDPPNSGENLVEVPSATYRLQITPAFDLYAAADLCSYLSEVGVGAVYLSPLLQSARGSQHGYDVVDFARIDTARGGAAGWQALVAAAREHGLEIVVDIVPNHSGVAEASENPAWWSVLRLGSASPYARWFDIDWTRGRLLLPVLGDEFDASRDLEVVGDELRYYEHRFPITPGTCEGKPADVHARQHYELVNYRRADTEQNYRRFFAVTTLAGLRVEDPVVFDATHQEVRRWLRDDGVAGVRVDHPDGLVDPLDYLRRLRGIAPHAWLVVEKILEPGEALPTSWPVDGTTGYDAIVAGFLFLLHPASFHFPRDLGWSIPLIGFVVAAPYLAFGWYTTGRTYGDALLGLRVVNHDGKKLHFLVALLRAIACVVFPIGVLWVAVSGANRSVQDVVFRTSVVYDWSANPDGTVH
jgi:maltooligosyltrehalose synthase